MRAETTKRIRNNLKVTKANHSFRMKQAIFDAIRVRREIHLDLGRTLGNLERLFRTKQYMASFKTIKSFSVSKKLKNEESRQQGIHDFRSLLLQYHEKTLRNYFGRYRAIVKSKSSRSNNVKKIMLKIDNVNLREGFEAWRKYTMDQNLIQEVNETGPVTEEVFEANRTITNLKAFMRKENYTEEEIAKKVESVNDQNHYLMNKLVKRLKLSKDEKFMCRCFEHWRMWIGVKRIFKYHLRKCNNSIKPVLCDLYHAFERWKRGDAEMVRQLDTFDFAELADMNIEQSKVLDGLADREAEDSAVINHLNLQRDELLDNYVKAQKLALSLLKDNHRHSREQAFNRWKAY